MRLLRRIISILVRMMSRKSPRRHKNSPLVQREVTLVLSSIEDGPSMGEYKIATAIQPDYEHLELVSYN